MLETVKSRHLPTLIKLDGIGELLVDLSDYHGKFTTETALLISPYVFVRPSELVLNGNIDFEKSYWVIPAELMKMERDHLIPFSHQVKSLFLALFPITEDSQYIFPSDRNNEKSMNSQTVNQTIKRRKI